MNILVTGDKGYIGAVMVPMLLREGHNVVGLDCDWFEGSTFGDWRCEVASNRKDLRDLQ